MNPEYTPILIVGVLIALYIIYMIKDAIYTYAREVALTNKELITLSQEEFIKDWGNFLEHYFHYYRNLDDKGKREFCNKTHKLLKRIDIVATDFDEITPEMRVLLIATLTQLTFGLKKLGLYNFKTIRLYRDHFTIKNNTEFYEGITFSNKMIALSWRHFERGLLNQNDGTHIGLYHIAEALQQTVNNGVFFDTHFASYIDAWTEKVEKLVQHNHGFASLIGSFNHPSNLFPRVVEIFFERPYDLKEASVDAYAHTCVLLNQNPLNITANYQYSFETFNRLNLVSSLPAKVRKIYRHHQWHWSYNLSIFMPIIATIAFYFLLKEILITNIQFFLAYLILSIIFLIALFRINNRIEMYSNAFWLYVFCLLSLTPLILISLITLNNKIIIGSPETSTHKISDYTYIVHNTKRGNYSYVEVRLRYKDHFLDNFYRAREFDYENLPTKTFYNYSTEYTIAKGLLGIDVVMSKKLKYTP